MTLGRGQEDGDFFSGERVYLPTLRHLWKELAWLKGHVDGNQPVFDGLTQKAAQHSHVVLHSLRSQPLIELVGDHRSDPVTSDFSQLE
ncbi:MAG: hypothetical protein CV090_09340 [Nitrospira sp. WS238]|nr:hypothetical protein [Nitrospira sp. WS238]